MKSKLITTTLINLVAFLIIPILVFAEEPSPEPSMPGRIERTGTHFEITDSKYLNVSLQSTEEITVILESIPKTISLLIEASTPTNSAALTIGGLVPNASYYKYADSYRNEEIITADAEGKYVFLQELNLPHHIWFQETRGTVFLPRDCSTFGIWDELSSACTLTQDLTESVEITADNITLDCDSHSIIGSATGYGIYSNNKSGFTIKNCAINNFSYGAYLLRSDNNAFIDNSINSNLSRGILFVGSSYNQIINNDIYSNAYTGIEASWVWNATLIRSHYNEIIENDIYSNGNGIQLRGSSFNGIRENSIYSNDGFGIYITPIYYGSSDNEITGNKISSNGLHGLALGSSNSTVQNNIFENCGMFVFQGSQGNNVTNNNVNGKPLVYLENASNLTIDNAGQVILLNSDNVTIRDLNLSRNSVGIQLYKTNNSTIINNTVSSNSQQYGLIQYAGTGIYFQESNNNNITGNTINNNWLGIFLDSSDGNTISNNSFEGNGGYGIVATASDNNAISLNTIRRGSRFGIYLSDSRDSVISDNGVYDNNYTGIGIWIGSTNTLLDSNIIANNNTGLYLYHSFQTTVKDNNIKSNSAGLRLWNTVESTIFHNNFKDNSQQADIWLSQPYWPSTNFFDNGLPDGGNYWSDYDTSVEGCNDANNDGICDAPYTLWRGHQDRYPFMEESGWAIPLNQPPTISNLNQYKSDAQTEISEGGITTESIVVFKATLTDPDNDQVKLQIELKKFGQPFDESGILESGLTLSGNEATITATDLTNGQYKWRARAVDSKEAPSAWQEFGTAGNVDFEVKLVPLYTQVASDFPSRRETESWFDKPYAKGVLGNYDCGSTIANCGCAITSEVMILRFHGVTTTLDNNDVNPLVFNNWLTNNNGYWQGGGVKWEKIQEYSRDKDGFARVIYDGSVDYKDNITLDLYLDDLHPVILYEKVIVQGELTTHFIVADGKLATTYTIKDPAWYNTKKLIQPVGSYARDYNNYFYGLRLFHPVLALRGVDSISLNLASPAELLVTNPQGQRLGKDPMNNISYNEIPGGSYYQEGIGNPFPEIPTLTKESKFIWIPDPLDGQYDIQVIGTETESYTMELLAYDQNGNPKDIIYQASTTADIVQSFELNYSKENIQETESYRIIDIDIKPSSYPNSINLKSKGVTPVAVLTDQFFDAKDVIVDSITFVGASPKKGKFEDLDNDGYLDLILHFDTQSLQLSPTSTEAVLIGQLANGNLIKGTDSVRIVQHTAGQTIFTKLFSYINQFIQNIVSVIGLAAITK